MSEETSRPLARIPVGIKETRVDEAGRLKLTSEFQEFLNAVGDKEVFVTTADRKAARVYTSSGWAAAEALMNSVREQAAKDVYLIMMKYGQMASVDKQGRLLLKQELRELLELENKPAFLLGKKGYIEVLPKAFYESRTAKAEESLEEKLRRLEELGLD